MNFTVTCKSIKEFDAESGKYVRCDHTVEVSTGQVGTFVQCPACENDIEVQNPTMMSGASPISTTPTTSANRSNANLPEEVTGDVEAESVTPTRAKAATPSQTQSHNPAPQAEGAQKEKTEGQDCDQFRISASPCLP